MGCKTALVSDLPIKLYNEREQTEPGSAANKTTF